MLVRVSYSLPLRCCTVSLCVETEAGQRELWLRQNECYLNSTHLKTARGCWKEMRDSECG